MALEQVWIHQDDWWYFRHLQKKVWLGYINFGKFYMFLNMKENKVHYRHLIWWFDERQTRYVLFMVTAIQLKELSGSGLLDLKLMISTLRIKNARVLRRRWRSHQNRITHLWITIHEHFLKLCNINRYDVWDLQDGKKSDESICICESLYKRNEKTQLLFSETTDWLSW